MLHEILETALGLVGLALTLVASVLGYRTVVFHAIPIGWGVLEAILSPNLFPAVPWWQPPLVFSGILYVAVWVFYFAGKLKGA